MYAESRPYRCVRHQVLLIVALVCSVAGHAGNLPQLPSGPKGSGGFGAFYTTLEYDAAWDEPWRIGEHADVVVRFDTGAHRFVFWRGTSYIPCWVTDTGVWYTNEFVERRGDDSPNTQGCCEPMSDKQCRYSHVRIIESSDARVVVHWRYAPVDVNYSHPFIDPETGWSDWVDEYYYIYPDAVGVREITVHSTAPEAWMEWHEAIVLNQPGTVPEDNIETGAVSVANMQGESRTYAWTEAGAPDFDKALGDANILRVNLKSRMKPFAVIPPVRKAGGQVITPYRGHGKGSCFNFWDHWPVSTTASDGRLADSAENPSHSSLAHIAHGGASQWKYHAKGDNWRTKIMLHGMTDRDVVDLVPLAKSWENAPSIELEGDGYSVMGYDQAERAYQLKRDCAESKPLAFSILADKDHPVFNPAFVVQNWGGTDRDIELRLNGTAVEPGKAFRVGRRDTLDGADLIVWFETQSVEPLTVLIAGR